MERAVISVRKDKMEDVENAIRKAFPEQIIETALVVYGSPEINASLIVAAMAAGASSISKS